MAQNPKKFLSEVDFNAAVKLAGSAGTSGQVLLSGGTGATPTWGSFTGITSSSYVAVGVLAADQALTVSGTDTLISFVDYVDPQGWWNPTTKRLTPTTAGYYNITYQTLWTALTSTSQTNAQIRKNGNSETIQQRTPDANTPYFMSASKVIYLNGSTDYIEFTAWSPVTTQSLSQGNAAGSGTNFSAQLVTSGANITSNSLVLKADSGTTEGTDLYTFNGSASKTLNFVSNTASGLTITETSGTWTFGTNATTANTANTIVLRDASGNFAANAITSTTQKYGTGIGAPTFTSYSGGVRSIYYDNISPSSAGYAVGIDGGVLWHGIPAADGGQFFKWYGGTTEVAKLSGTGILTASSFVSNVATGTAPFTVTSTTKVSNLNVDLVDGLHADSTNTGSTLVSRDSNGSFAANAIASTTMFSSSSGGFGTASALNSARLSVLQTTSGIGVVIRANASNSDNLTEWQYDNGGLAASMGTAGDLLLSSITAGTNITAYGTINGQYTDWTYLLANFR